MGLAILRKLANGFTIDWHRNVRREDILGARNVEDLTLMGRDLRGFNRQILRAALIVSLSERLKPTAFVETGTYLGETAIAAHDLLAVPVFTAEVSLANYLQAHLTRLRTGRLGSIHQYLGNSPDFLRRLAPGNRLGSRPFFYLDAHWGDYCPLADELVAIFKGFPWAVVVVDDFQVPARPDFGYDSYGGIPIGVDVVKTVLKPQARLFFPDHDPALESGHRRGTLLLTHGVDIPGDLAEWGFPFTLYRECQMAAERP
jgi:hypothetical protein